MKVGFFFTYGYSLNTWKNSGTLSREIKFIEELSKKQDSEFYLFTYGDELDLKIRLNNLNIKVFPIYKKIRYTKSRLLNYLFSFAIPFKYKNEIKEVDILHQNQLLGSWVVLIAKYLFDKPVYIRTGYDMYSFSLQENKNYLVKFLYKILTLITIKLSNLYTVSSKSDKYFIESRFSKSKKIVIRSNWVNSVKAERVNINNKILLVGRLEEQKNYKLLLNELKNTGSKYQIDIVGEGSQLKELQNLSKLNDVNINFLGKLDNNELLHLYFNYTFFITTSKYEGNPKTLLEAMSSGCVVIASNIPNHRELISNYEDGILFDLNNPKLGNILEKILYDKDKINIISKNSSEKIINSNSLEKLVELTTKDYINLVQTF